MKKIFAAFSLLSLFSLVSPLPIFAVDFCPAGQFDSLCKLDAGGLGSVIRNIIVAILIIAAVISLFFLIYGGIKWIMSGGDKAKIGEARAMLTAAIVGLIITFLSYFILSIVLGFFGLKVQDLQLPKLTP